MKKPLIVIGLILFAWAMYANQRQPEKRIVKPSDPLASQEAKQTQNDQESTTKAINDLVGVIRIEQQNEAEDRQAQKDRDKADQDIQGKLANYTLLLGLVGFLQFAALLGTGYIIYLQIRTSRYSEHAQIRVRIRPLKLTFNPIYQYSVHFRIANFGRSAAFITKAECVAYTVPGAFLGEIGQDMTTFDIRLPKVITPDDSVKRTSLFLLRTDEPAKEMISEIKAERMFVEIRGFIHYTDVFGKNRETRFRYIWRFFDFDLREEGRSGEWQIQGTEEENKET